MEFKQESDVYDGDSDCTFVTLDSDQGECEDSPLPPHTKIKSEVTSPVNTQTDHIIKPTEIKLNKKRLSGAARRKRARRAFIMSVRNDALEQFSSTTRFQQDDLCFNFGEQSHNALPQSNGSSIQIKEEDDSLKMAIIHVFHPTICLTDKLHLTIVQNILNDIDQLPLNGTGPHPSFSDCHFAAGIFYLTCEDEDTRLWLERAVRRITAQTKARVRIVRADNIYEPYKRDTKVVVSVPGAKVQDAALILRRLQVQNRGLHTDGWRILNTVPKTSGLTLFMAIDEESKRWLEERNGFAHLALGRVQLKPLTKNRKA